MRTIEMGPEQLHGGTGQKEDSAGVKEHRKITQLGAQEGTALADGLNGEPYFTKSNGCQWILVTEVMSKFIRE